MNPNARIVHGLTGLPTLAFHVQVSVAVLRA